MKKLALSLLMLLVATTMSAQTIMNGDLNHDGKIDISDVTALVNVALGKSQTEVIRVDPDPHEYVDLGLPSGTLWATCNVGADNPEDYGLYFAWGETVGYTQDTSDGRRFNWASYQLCNGSERALTRYCYDSSYGYNGFTDTLTELLPENDAATANWGANWRMPSKDQLIELKTNCTWTWTTRNGKNGYEVVGPNGNSLFLPAAGYRGSSLYDVGEDGEYWLRTLSTSTPGYAYHLNFISNYVDWANFSRYMGRSVRPVRVS